MHKRATTAWCASAPGTRGAPRSLYHMCMCVLLLIWDAARRRARSGACCDRLKRHDREVPAFTRAPETAAFLTTGCSGVLWHQPGPQSPDTAACTRMPDAAIDKLSAADCVRGGWSEEQPAEPLSALESEICSCWGIPWPLARESALSDAGTHGVHVPECAVVSGRELARRGFERELQSGRRGVRR